MTMTAGDTVHLLDNLVIDHDAGFEHPDMRWYRTQADGRRHYLW